MKTLLLLRHAKSDWSADYGPDHDRPLNERGLRSARVIGRALADDGEVPELVLTSSAVRAHATVELAAEAGEWESEIVVEPRLYGAGVDEAVAVAAGAPDVARLMLVGHQPTWSVLLSRLTGERIEMKTATVAVIRFDIEEWDQLGSAPGEVARVYRPRDYL